MNNSLDIIKKIAYAPSGLDITELVLDNESQDYHGCQFQLNDKQIICRTGKITPKKVGQFVTFWRRNAQGITEPFNENDSIDFYIINVCLADRVGQFIIPKSVLIAKGILSTARKDGKRGFRVYPIWDVAVNKQAKQTQRWQLEYFVEFGAEQSLERLRALLA